MTAQKTAPAGTAGADKAPAAATGNAVARRGDLVVIHLRHHERQGGQPREYHDFWLGQVTSVTRDGLVRLYRPAGTFSWDTDGRGRPFALRKLKKDLRFNLLARRRFLRGSSTLNNTDSKTMRRFLPYA